MSVNPVAIENFFFSAMANGWVKNTKKISIPDLPGSKAISFKLGDLSMLDCYFVTPHSNKSVGSTMIWHDGIPVWVMYYGGWYEKVAIPFLKDCLRRVYVDEQCFYGGRGPRFMQSKLFTYINRIERNNFDDFSGEECIYNIDEMILGRHWYNGMLL